MKDDSDYRGLPDLTWVCHYPSCVDYRGGSRESPEGFLSGTLTWINNGPRASDRRFQVKAYSLG